MKPEIQQLKQERVQIQKDLMDNKIPKRVFSHIYLGTEIMAQYAGLDIKEALFHPEILKDTIIELNGKIRCDSTLYSGKVQSPMIYQTLDAQNEIMSEAGFIQHPNTVGLLQEEYDDMIADPYACILDHVMPRNYKDMRFGEKGAFSQYTFAKMMIAQKSFAFTMLPHEQHEETEEDFGHYPGCVNSFAELNYAYTPFDILTDNMRSFTGMLGDIRRMPDKVAQAVEAIYPLNLKASIPYVISDYSYVMYPLHMATFMREKDFEKLWWPTWLRQCNDLASMGVRTEAFCEDDWTRYLDYLQDLPALSKLQFEYGDPKLIKEKLGKKHILSGIFPVTSLNTCTKDEIIYKTREFLDIMMPGGNFEFKFDKDPLTLADVNMENLIALVDTINQYGEYKNAGQTAGMAFNKEDYKLSDAPAFQSKYFRTWEEYKQIHPYTPESAKEQIMALEEQMLKEVYFLCM